MQFLSAFTIHSKNFDRKHFSFSNRMKDLQIAPSSSTQIDMAEALRHVMTSTFRLDSAIAMDGAYDYNIMDGELDADDIFPHIIKLSDELPTILQGHLTPEQAAAMDDHLVECLARMVFGSNKIEDAGGDYDITLKHIPLKTAGKDDAKLPNDGEELGLSYRQRCV